MGEWLTVSQREQAILKDESFPSSRSYIDLLPLVEVPNNLTGLHILDIGGGGSDFTAVLLEKGADAYAIDPLYANRSKLISQIKNHLREQLVSGINPIDTAYLSRQNKALEHFKESARVSPEHYLARLATKTGFLDNTFEYVFSFNCITEFLGLDENVLISAVTEAIRITKPGGIIQIYPINESYSQSTLKILQTRNPRDFVKIQTRKNTEEVLFQWLAAQNSIHFTPAPAGLSNHMRLVIKRLA